MKPLIFKVIMVGSALALLTTALASIVATGSWVLDWEICPLGPF